MELTVESNSSNLFMVGIQSWQLVQIFDKTNLVVSTDFEGRDMMIEADVSVGTIAGGDATVTTIMAHPPLNTSDLSLEEFLDTILDSNTTKGIKLDFKDLEVVEPSLIAIKSRASKV